MSGYRVNPSGWVNSMNMIVRAKVSRLSNDGVSEGCEFLAAAKLMFVGTPSLVQGSGGRNASRLYAGALLNVSEGQYGLTRLKASTIPARRQRASRSGGWKKTAVGFRQCCR